MLDSRGLLRDLGVLVPGVGGILLGELRVLAEIEIVIFVIRLVGRVDLATGVLAFLALGFRILVGIRRPFMSFRSRLVIIVHSIVLGIQICNQVLRQHPSITSLFVRIDTNLPPSYI